MKIFISTIIFAVILGGLPANVWACGLGICKMEHSKSKDSENKPSCHGSSHEKLSKKPTEKDIVPSVKTDPQICPCPTSFPAFALFRSSESERSEVERSKSVHVTPLMQFAGYDLGIKWSRPPPKYSLFATLSGHLFLDIQIFLI